MNGSSSGKSMLLRRRAAAGACGAPRYQQAAVEVLVGGLDVGRLAPLALSDAAVAELVDGGEAAAVTYVRGLAAGSAHIYLQHQPALASANASFVVVDASQAVETAAFVV